MGGGFSRIFFGGESILARFNLCLLNDLFFNWQVLGRLLGAACLGNLGKIVGERGEWRIGS